MIVFSSLRSKEGKDLVAKDNLQMSVEGDTYTLTISNVTKSDEGEYTCTASSVAGSGDCAATLTVNIGTCTILLH